MKLKVIKTGAAYEAALARIEAIFDAVPNTPDGDELELLSLLVENYEAAQFPIDLPDPLTAIRFRMEQQGLKQKDLVPYLGSPAKVSEVLAGRRALSVSMMRHLVEEMGIPAEVLLRQPQSKQSGASVGGASVDEDDPVEECRFPLAEMLKRGWFSGFSGTLAQAKAQKAALFQSFMAPVGPRVSCALNRQHVRSGAAMDEGALSAWRIRVVTLALNDVLPVYRTNSITPEFLAEVARLSYFEAGPKLAQEFLHKNGIHFVVERHLSKTFLDGAAIKMPDGSPLVALTLRYDRLDNFWFTLCHELAHIALHLDHDGVDAFFDDLNEEGTDKCEREADEMAREALIPAKLWRSSDVSRDGSAASVRALAEQLRISPAIPAGRLRFEKKDYTLLRDLIGTRLVRPLFAPTP